MPWDSASLPLSSAWIFPKKTKWTDKKFIHRWVKGKSPLKWNGNQVKEPKPENIKLKKIISLMQNVNVIWHPLPTVGHIYNQAGRMKLKQKTKFDETATRPNCSPANHYVIERKVKFQPKSTRKKNATRKKKHPIQRIEKKNSSRVKKYLATIRFETKTYPLIPTVKTTSQNKNIRPTTTRAERTSGLS